MLVQDSCKSTLQSAIPGIFCRTSLGRMNMMSSILTPQLNPANISGEIHSSSTSMSTKKDERVPQWSHQETREFISIRAELERDFTVAKRNKTLWQVVSTKMKERGYRRSPDQCKCKWKNLVNRYKGKETSDPENGRQCPFFDELQAVFTERAKNMQRMLQEQPEAVGPAQAKKKLKGLSVGDRSSDDFSDDDEDGGGDESDEERMPRSNRKRKPEQQRQQLQRSNTGLRTAASGNSSGLLLETLQEFLQQQQRNEMQWREMMEKRAQERRLFEEEWRQSMEKLERERLLVERAWREREEQRRMREESRAEKRDALLTSLLNKLIQQDRF